MTMSKPENSSESAKEMSENDSKKLSELRVVDLKAELEKRGLDKNGVKKDLVERLQKALQNDGNDPETYLFDIADKKPGKRLSTSSSHQGDEVVVGEKTDPEPVSANKNESIEEVDNSEKTKSSDEKTVEEESEKQPEDDKMNQSESESINLTLEDEEIINDESSGQIVDLSESVQQNDEKTSPNDTVLDEEETKDTSTGTVQPQKKKQEQEASMNSSIGSSDTDSAQKKSASSPRLLWITNVPKNTRANELKQLLSTCGKVVCAKVVVNARFPGSCCFGYITMGSVEDAENVIDKLNNTEFNGQIIKIDKFENIKADNLNPAKKVKKDETKATSAASAEKKDDSNKANKKSPEEKKEKEKETARKSDGAKERLNVTSESPQRRKSGTSDRSSRGRRRSLSKDRVRERPPPRSNSRGHHRSNVLTFDKIKEERERQRMRDRERALREDNRRRHEEAIRLREMREITRRQRSEADRLEREREKLKQERDRIEREKTELMKLERERQKIEREKLELERIEFQRIRQRLEEDRRAVKRPVSVPYRREEPFEPQERKRPVERHFESSASHTPRFEPPQHSHEPPTKKFSSSKDSFKRLSYEKQDSFADKRREYNSERSHQNPVNRSASGMNKYERPYENPRPRVSRDGPSRESQSNVPIRKRDSYGGERERSPHFRPMPERDRELMQQPGKSERDHHYNESNVADRWRHETSNTPQSKTFGATNQKSSWSANKGSWRPDPPTIDRWNPRTSSSGRSSLNQQYSNNSHHTNIAPACPPPPGINNYSDRFDYNKSSGMRKY